MSGIGGIFYRNGKPVHLNQLHMIGESLAHRGPDGINYYHKDSFGFVSCRLYDTPESVFEALPTAPEDDNFVITFQGRIDNRRELYDKIGWIKPLVTVTDSELVLAAYRKWRKRCVDNLLGDFAFAIWDQNERQLFCARDHMGVKPFYYYCDDRIFLFASEIKALFSISEIYEELNEDRVADYFTCGTTEKISTFYRGVLRLPSAHYLLVNSSLSEIVEYHQFCSNVHQENDNDNYREQFREIFEKAVSCRLRTNYKIGAYLSGGLDSSSVTCMAADLLSKKSTRTLNTYSGVFDSITQCDERKYFNSVFEKFKINPYFVVADKIDPSQWVAGLIANEDEPCDAFHFFMQNELLEKAQHHGVRVMCDGHDGDSAVSYGLGLLSELAMAFKFKLLFQQCSNSKHTEFQTVRKVLSVVKNTIYANHGYPIYRLIEKNRVTVLLKKLSKDFVQRGDINERLLMYERTKPRLGQREKDFHLKSLLQPRQLLALEFFERQHVRRHMVACFPFFDLRLIEFCLSLPSDKKYYKGYNRFIVRRSLEYILPQNISNRKSKTDFSASLYNAYMKRAGTWLIDLFDSVDLKLYTRWLCEERLTSNVEKLRRGTLSFTTLREILTIASFILWYEKKAF